MKIKYYLGVRSQTIDCKGNADRLLKQFGHCHPAAIASSVSSQQEPVAV